MIIKIILILVVWAIFWGGSMGEFYYLDRENYEFTDIFVIVSFFLAPFIFVGVGVFILIYKNMKNKKE